jgi:hypothetical protein
MEVGMFGFGPLEVVFFVLVLIGLGTVIRWVLRGLTRH